MGEIKVDAPGKVVAGGMGDTIKISDITTGIGVILFDRVKKVGTGRHMILAPFVQRDIREMVSLIQEKGAIDGSILAKIAGGADFMQSQMGARLSQKVIDTCGQMGIKISGQDMGGKGKRTLVTILASGETKVISASGEKKI